MSMYESEPGRRSTAKLLTKDEARRIAANIAPGQTNHPRSNWSKHRSRLSTSRRCGARLIHVRFGGKADINLTPRPLLTQSGHEGRQITSPDFVRIRRRHVVSNSPKPKRPRTKRCAFRATLTSYLGIWQRDGLPLLSHWADHTCA